MSCVRVRVRGEVGMRVTVLNLIKVWRVLIESRTVGLSRKNVVPSGRRRRGCEDELEENEKEEKEGSGRNAGLLFSDRESLTRRK